MEASMDLRSLLLVFLAVVFVASEDTDTSDPSSIQVDYPWLITLQSVQQEIPNSGAARLQVRYTENTPGLLISVHDSVVKKKIELDQTEEADGTKVISFSWENYSESSFVMMMVMSADKLTRQMIVFKSSTQPATVTQTEFPRPDVSIMPDGDLVFTPGSDISATLYVTAREGEVLSDLQVNADLFALDREAGEFRAFRDDSDLLTKNISEASSTQGQADITIHTSARPISGMLQVSVSSSVYQDEDVIVSEQTITLGKYFYPPRQGGPLPLGYVGIARMDERDTKYCSVDRQFPCVMQCTGIGLHLTGLTVVEELGGGRTRLVELMDVPLFDYPISRSAQWEVTPRPGDLPGQVRRFTCRAETIMGRFGTLDASRTKEVTISQDPEISRENSNVLVRTEGQTATVTIQCAATGYPVPELSLAVEYEHFVDYLDFDNIIKPQGQNQIIGTKVITVPPTHSPEIVRGLITAIRCMANVNATYNFVSDELKLPEDSEGVWRAPRN